jgi:two-component system chemotaxis response regulator CheB
MAERKTGRIILIGGSAGCLDVLLQLVAGLPGSFAWPVVVVVHRKSAVDSPLVELLAAKTTLMVQEIEEKDTVAGGCVYLVPGNYHVLFEQDGTFALDASERVNFSRPSIDVVFQSAAGVYGEGVTAILLSGGNADGTEGCRQILLHKGITIAQAPATAVVAYMVEHAIRSNVIKYVMNIAEMTSYLSSLA